MSRIHNEMQIKLSQWFISVDPSKGQEPEVSDSSFHSPRIFQSDRHQVLQSDCRDCETALHEDTIFDNSCLEQSSFDVTYLTELDPMWHGDELTFISNPDVALFGNLPARAVCAADCAAATAGFPLNSLFWCAGCQGSLYTLDGNVQTHIGGVQASSLEITR